MPLDYVSPRGAERRAKTIRDRNYREKVYLNGPHLSDDKEFIRVPSVWPNQWLINVLKKKQFQFSPGDIPFWVRPTVVSDGEKGRAPEWWLAWAVQQYSMAWPDWAAQKREESE